MPKSYTATLSPKYKRIGQPVDGCITYEVVFQDADGKERGGFTLVQMLDGTNLYALGQVEATIASPVPDGLKNLSLANVPAATAGLQAMVDAYDAAGAFDALYPVWPAGPQS